MQVIDIEVSVKIYCESEFQSGEQFLTLSPETDLFSLDLIALCSALIKY